MTLVAERLPRAERRRVSWPAALDLAVKGLLLLLVVRVGLDPEWGHLEGKAPGTRAVAYPMLALVVPALALVRRRHRSHPRPYPWVADLLVTVPAFSDMLGNRLDLYDRVVWFDDLVHFGNAALISAAALVLWGPQERGLQQCLSMAVAVGVTVSLAWEVWEYFAFVTRSREALTAYTDTIGDLVLGWCGAVTAAVTVAAGRPHQAHLHVVPAPYLPGSPLVAREGDRARDAA